MSAIRPLSLVLALLSLAAVGVDESYGQQARRYRPARPTVSPYLNLLRNNDNGGLPNYYSLVRPQLQQQAFNNQQQMFNQQQMVVANQQEAAIGSLTSQLQPGMAPTGKSGGYMNSDRFFMTRGMGPVAGQRRR